MLVNWLQPYTLHAEVETKYAQVNKGREFLVQLFVEQVVELPLRKHRQFGDGDLEFIHLERNIIAVEITSVKMFWFRGR